MDTSRPTAHPPREINSIAETCSAALQNMPRLEIWLKEHGLPVDPALVPLMCLQTAFFTPWLPSETCHQISRLTVWLMAIDNVLDAPDTPETAGPEETSARVRAWHRILAEPAGPQDDSHEDPVDPVASALAEIVHALHRDGCPELVAVWRESMCQTLTGMHRERERAQAAEAGGRALPLAEYLRDGAWTIGVEQQVTALWALMDEPGLSRRLPVLLGALRQAALAIRLLNDLRGHHREQAEGKTDALSLGLSEQEAYQRAEAGIENCRRALAPLTAAGYGSAVALERVVLWHARMYHRFDPVRPGPTASTPLADGTGRTPFVPHPEEAVPPMSTEQEVLETIASGGEYDTAKLADLFDRLEPVDTDFLIGTWQGGGFECSGENAELLAKMRWYGKRFADADHVEPLLCRDEDGAVYSYEELGLATLHEVVHRGKQSTAMVYDQLPVIDHFRRLTDDVLLGVMVKKGASADFYFHLTRVPAAPGPAPRPSGDGG
ncbi:GXWXG domain-containing protein [Streptomyces sp. NPDC018019]|uniref:GXWXG domain-containing protein n=1 Tax=Streptomyces sp. NPDC018019 TaxID=3365030 RepID=UPI00379AC761